MPAQINANKRIQKPLSQNQKGQIIWKANEVGFTHLCKNPSESSQYYRDKVLKTFLSNSNLVILFKEDMKGIRLYAQHVTEKNSQAWWL